MRRMLLPLAGLVLLNVVGCHLVQGKCDCDGPGGCASCASHASPISPAPIAHSAESIKEMPRVTPDK